MSRITQLMRVTTLTPSPIPTREELREEVRRMTAENDAQRILDLREVVATLREVGGESHEIARAAALLARLELSA